jgi:hypothetical protein
MLARSRYSLPHAQIQKIVNAFHLFSWLNLSIKLSLSFVSLLMLFFSVSFLTKI